MKPRRLLIAINARFRVFSLFMLVASGISRGEIVFEKALSPGLRVEVNRTAIPYKPPSSEEENVLKAKFPGGGFVKPDAVYEYALKLKEATNSFSRTLWTTEFKFYDRGPAVPSHFKILDVAGLGTNRILILMKAGMSTGCHFVSTSTNAGSAQHQSGQHLYGDSPAFGKIVVAGHYFATNSTEGIIELELAIKEKVRWRLKDERFEEEVQAKPPKNIPVPPLPPLPGLARH